MRHELSYNTQFYRVSTVGGKRYKASILRHCVSLWPCQQLRQAVESGIAVVLFLPGHWVQQTRWDETAAVNGLVTS